MLRAIYIKILKCIFFAIFYGFLVYFYLYVVQNKSYRIDKSAIALNAMQKDENLSQSKDKYENQDTVDEIGVKDEFFGIESKITAFDKEKPKNIV